MVLETASCIRTRLEAAERVLAEYAHRYGLTPQARAFFANCRNEENIGSPGQTSTDTLAASKPRPPRADLTLVPGGQAHAPRGPLPSEDAVHAGYPVPS